jgi:N,N'-diacetylbacillosaminyl-diphospho-undecaprenol alpha-1,3-N-acetylgalactosaminyltransferase
VKEAVVACAGERVGCRIVHLLHNPVSAKRFAEPIVSFLRGKGLEAELWIEPWIGYEGILASVAVPARHSWFDVSANPVRVLARILDLVSEFRRTRPNAIHTHQCRASLLPLLAARIARVRVRVYHNHGVPYIGHRGPVRWALRLVERINTALATDVMTVNTALARVLESDGLVRPGKCRVPAKGSACGIDFGEFPGAYFGDQGRRSARASLGIEQGGFVLAYIGRPVRRKGFDLLLEAWKTGLLPDTRNVLLLVGCREEDVRGRLGHVPTGIRALGILRDVREALAACDAVVLPSYHEGLSYSLLEGAAAGRPLIASRIPGMEAILEDGVSGVLFAPGNRDGLLSAILRLKENPDERLRMGMAARSLVQRDFERNVVLESLWRIYQDIGLA